MFKQYRHVEKYKKYPVGFTTESLSLDVRLCITSATGMMVIGESLGDSTQRGMGRGWRGTWTNK